MMKRCLYVALLAMMVAGPVHAASPKNGAKLYNVHCASCHGMQGRAEMPGVPDFKRHGLFKPDATLVNLVERGSRAMPAYRGLLSREEILDILAYIRSFY